MTPYDVTAGSGKKAWWICGKGHHYESTIVSRTKKENPRGCPYCAGKKVLVGFNDLATIAPDIANEWDYERNNELTPYDVTAGANKKVWWVCEKGHSWEATIAARRKTGCPECAKHKKTSQVEQAVFFYVKQYAHDAVSGYKIGSHSELDIFIPSRNIAIEYDGVFYHMDVEHDIKKDKWCKENDIVLYRIREPKCPILDSTSICLFRNSTFLDDDLNNVIANLIDLIFKVKIKPDVMAHKNEILQHLASRELENSVANKHPLIASQWNYEKNFPLLPENVSSVTHVHYWWKCHECGYEWEDTPFLRCRSKRAYGKCPCCSSAPHKHDI